MSTRAATWMKTLRRNRTSRGQCQRGGKPVSGGFKNCQDCRDYMVEYKRNWRVRDE